MNPRKIVGIVLLVVGVVGLIWGAQQYHHQIVDGNTSMLHKASVTRLGGGPMGKDALDFNSRDISPKKKMLAISIILLGGLLTIVGIFLLNKTVSAPIDADTIDHEKEALEGSTFKL